VLYQNATGLIPVKAVAKPAQQFGHEFGLASPLCQRANSCIFVQLLLVKSKKLYSKFPFIIIIIINNISVGNSCTH
jgi:hypothetical protein